MSASITALVCDTAGGKTASKTWRRGADGRPQLIGFDAGWQFPCHARTVTNIRDLAGFLYSLERVTGVFVVRGVPVPGLEPSRPVARRSRSRPGEPATFQESPGGQPWAMFDLDGFELPLDFNAHAPEAAIQYAIERLPECFHGITCFWQLSSKAGMVEPRKLRAHLWFWFDRPVDDDAMSRWASTFGVSVDTSELFAPSIQITPGAPTVEQLREQIQAAQRERREAAIASELAPFEENTARIREAFGGARDWPYTEPELEAIARDAGCTREEFMHRWIIQHGKQFYLYFWGRYLGPIVSEEIATNAATFLAPATSAGVDLKTVDSRGRLAPKTAAQLMSDYGMPARQVIADMTSDRSRYDVSTHTLLEAVCPLRPLAPQHDPDVAAWLRLLGGEKEQQLLEHTFARLSSR